MRISDGSSVVCSSDRRAAQRGSPQGLWPEVRSVIMLGMSYAPARDPLALERVADIGRIYVYAQGQDYHAVVKKGLKALARGLLVAGGGTLTVLVDNAPELGRAPCRERVRQ